MQLAVIKRLVVETAHLDRGELRQFAGQVLDVNAGAAINIGRIFIRGQQNAHCCYAPLA